MMRRKKYLVVFKADSYDTQTIVGLLKAMAKGGPATIVGLHEFPDPRLSIFHGGERSVTLSVRADCAEMFIGQLESYAPWKAIEV